MKKKILFCLIVLAMIINLLMCHTKIKAAEANDVSIDNIVSEIFGSNQISNIEYMYSLNDSADFIYVLFENNGYAIFNRQNGELLEYNLETVDFFKGNIQKKYYAGPFQYLIKVENDLFKNVYTNELICISDEEKEKTVQAVTSVVALR